MKKMLLVFIILGIFKSTNAQLTIYQNLDQTGTSATCLVSTIYKGSTIPGGLNNSIKSITLQQGFMATLAANEDGTGESFNYIAAISNITVNLAFTLQDRVSFIRVLPFHNANKRGVCSVTDSIPRALNGAWFYDWGNADVSALPTREYVLMTWGQNATLDANLNTWVNRPNVNTLLSFNEPDNTSQSNITVNNALIPYKRGLKAGFRTGSPACKEENYDNWLLDFTNLLKVDTTRVDFIAIHWYDWGNWSATNNANPNANDVLNRFKAYINNVWNLYKKPIWITEFNANVNRSATVQSQFMAVALPYLDSDPRVERYAYFFEHTFPPTNSNGLTPLGQQYANHVSVPSITANVIDTRSAYPPIVSWNASSLTSGGQAVSNFLPTFLATDLTAVNGIIRGSGLTLASGATLNGYWGANSFSTTTAANGISTNKFLTFRLQSTNGNIVSYKTIDSLKIRIAADGPIRYQLDYQINNGSFVTITTISGPSRTAANYKLDPINISNINALQNVPSTSTVTFRLTPFDATGTGVFYIGDGTTNTGADLSITGVLSPSNIVPVTLSSFKSQQVNQVIKLSWETKSEINFSHFILERGTSATNFEVIAHVASNGIETGSTYSYNNVLQNKKPQYFYRLKMVDKDGKYSYSNILVENFRTTKPFSIYPTQVINNPINIQFNEPISKGALRLLNMNGKLLQFIELKSNNTNYLLQTHHLPTGMYILQLQTATGIQTNKFTKQ